MTKTKAFRPSLAKRYALAHTDLQRTEKRLALLEESHERMRQTTTDAGVRTIQAERRASDLKAENVALRKVIAGLAQGLALLAAEGGK